MNTKTLTQVLPDFKASIAVFLVALPLALGVSVASGFPPIAGIMTSIIGGLVVGFMSGAPLQVSGAAAGLSVIMLEGVQRFGFAVLAVAIVIAGLLQIAAGIAQMGTFFRNIARPVVKGLLVGIGALILWGQLKQSVVTSHNAIVAIMAIAVMLFWSKIPLASIRRVPAPLAAVVLGALFAAASGLDMQMVVIPSTMSFGLADLSIASSTRWDVWFFAVQLAFIASAESLLSAKAVDQLHQGPRTHYNKELIAQGVGNSLCGLIGALPMTGVIVRSSTNVMAGAKTRLSTLMHGLWMLLFVAVFPGVLSMIPVASLSGILIVVGGKLIGEGEYRELYKTDRYDLITLVGTATVIFGYNLLAGVVLGMCLSFAKRYVVSEEKLASVVGRR